MADVPAAARATAERFIERKAEEVGRRPWSWERECTGSRKRLRCEYTLTARLERTDADVRCVGTFLLHAGDRRRYVVWAPRQRCIAGRRDA